MLNSRRPDRTLSRGFCRENVSRTSTLIDLRPGFDSFQSHMTTPRRPWQPTAARPHSSMPHASASGWTGTIAPGTRAAPRRGRGPARRPARGWFQAASFSSIRAGRGDGPHDRPGHRALSSPAYTRRVEQHAPPIACLAKASHGGMLGLDFHLGGEDPQLIEINTNPGGLLINLVLAQTLTACCDASGGAAAGLAAGSVSLDDLPGRVAEAFARSGRASAARRRSAASRSSTTTRRRNTCIPSSCSTGGCSSAPAGGPRSSTPASLEIRGDGLAAATSASHSSTTA